MKRFEMLEEISSRIIKIQSNHVIRVAVDGVDCAGKTMFAEELGQCIQSKNKNVIRASIDGFHNPAKTRYEMGKDSPEGYYLKSFNYDAIINKLLKPLGPGGGNKYITAVYDFKIEKVIHEKFKIAPENCILIFDGVFLMRLELQGFWDYKIWLDVDFSTVLDRAVKRDLQLFGDADKVRGRYMKRYIPGQKIYLDRVNPVSLADIAIDNSNPSEPIIIEKFH